jgi:hypothetical protein
MKPSRYGDAEQPTPSMQGERGEYVVLLKVPVTGARGLRHYLAKQFPHVLFDETRQMMFWHVFTVEAPESRREALVAHARAEFGATTITRAQL